MCTQILLTYDTPSTSVTPRIYFPCLNSRHDTCCVILILPQTQQPEGIIQREVYYFSFFYHRIKHLLSKEVFCISELLFCIYYCLTGQTKQSHREYTTWRLELPNPSFKRIYWTDTSLLDGQKNNGSQVTLVHTECKCLPYNFHKEKVQ